MSDTSTPSPFGTPAPKIIFQKISLSLVFSLVVINLLLVQNSVRAPVKQGRGRGGRFYVLRWWYSRSNIANCYYIISSWKIIRVILGLFLIGVAGRPKLLRDNPRVSSAVMRVTFSIVCSLFTAVGQVSEKSGRG